MTVTNLLTASAGLLAFLFGFFTIVARDRKAPYATNRILFVFVVVLLGVLLDLGAFLLPMHKDIFLMAGLICLMAAVSMTLYQTYRIHVRFSYFVDTVTWKNVGIFRAFRTFLHNMREKSYEHDPLPFPAPLTDKLKALDIDLEQDDRSLAIRTDHQRASEDILIELAKSFLETNCHVQYLSASRHPIDFISKLQKACEKAGIEWDELKKHVVVIDAYTRHFGFIDSIYPKRTAELKVDIDCITSGMSFAGVHSAGSKAFNNLKKKAKKDHAKKHRTPFLVIYEDPYALADLESADRYRVFIRHVLPSERQFGGMFTVMVESCIDDRDWRLLSSYADQSMDKT